MIVADLNSGFNTVCSDCCSMYCILPGFASYMDNNNQTLLNFGFVQLIGLIFIFIFAIFGLQFFGDRAEV
jgi:hypothetical protein